MQSWYEPGSWQSWINRPVSERVIASASGVEAGGCSWGGFGSGLVWRQNASRMGYDKFAVSAGAISVPLLDVFSFRSVEGDVHDMARSGSVIVSRRTAERLDVGVGDMLWVDTENPSPENAREIVAVFEDFPDNSLLAECEVAYDLGDRCLDDPSEWSFNYFVKPAPRDRSRAVRRLLGRGAPRNERRSGRGRRIYLGRACPSGFRPFRSSTSRPMPACRAPRGPR